MSEHLEQVAVVRWFRIAYPKLVLFSIPNAAKRSVGLANYMKQEGLLSGVSDLFLMKANKNYHGLFIEMKQPKGLVSEKQEYFLQQARHFGYHAVVCYGFDDAQAVILEYLRDV